MLDATQMNHQESYVFLKVFNQVQIFFFSEVLQPKVNEKSSEADVEETIKLVKLARKDNKIMKSGLDMSYKTFLANNPSLSTKTVLLSIL